MLYQTSFFTLQLVICKFWYYMYEGADRVRGRGEMRGREGGEEGEGGGRRGGGRREKRGGRRERGGRKGGREKEDFLRARSARRSKREEGDEGGGGGGEVRGGRGRGLPPCPPPHVSYYGVVGYFDFKSSNMALQN